MPTISDAYSVVKAKLVAGLATAGVTLPVRWRGDDTDSSGGGELPDTPAPFLFCNLETMSGEIAGFGGGRGSNLYRNWGWLYVYVWVPRGDGSEPEALGYGETIADIFRSFRDATISVMSSSVVAGGAGGDLAPPGLNSAVNAYSYALVEIRLFFDQVG